MRGNFSFWFSTKYLDAETRLYYYGYRYYSPELGRWLSRDLIEEKGGLNLYCFVGNNSIAQTDMLGMFSAADVVEAYHQRSMAIAAANIACDCKCVDEKKDYHISGGVSRSDTVFGYSSFRNCIGGDCCGPIDTTYYWWDCYSGTAEGDKLNRGWSISTIAYYKTAKPRFGGIIGGTDDTKRLDMASAVIYEKCVGGKLQTDMLASNGLEFNWTFWGQTWTVP